MSQRTPDVDPHVDPHVDTVNLGQPEPNPFKDTKATGINKRPQSAPVEVRAPGRKTSGLGSGLVGDYIGDGQHHGGDEQAVYAVAREDLDRWSGRLRRPVPNGFFGENLTTVGIDVNQARLGERWRIGDTVELVVTCPRIPCSTFRGWVDERGWLKTFTADARPGAYLAVAVGGFISSGDRLEVLWRPDHDVSITMAFRALTTDRGLLPALAAAGDDLSPELRESVAAYSG